jgi:hypothetical protein
MRGNVNAKNANADMRRRSHRIRMDAVARRACVAQSPVALIAGAGYLSVLPPPIE